MPFLSSECTANRRSSSFTGFSYILIRRDSFICSCSIREGSRSSLSISCSNSCSSISSRFPSNSLRAWICSVIKLRSSSSESDENPPFRQFLLLVVPLAGPGDLAEIRERDLDNAHVLTCSLACIKLLFDFVLSSLFGLFGYSYSSISSATLSNSVLL